MEQEPKFYICRKCGNVAVLLTDGGKDIEGMERLTSEQHEGAGEKHLPVVERKGSEIEVCVGSTLHPMTEEHHIGWVALQTCCGLHCKKLSSTGEAKVCFVLPAGESPVAVYAYCNMHGLWKTEVR